MSAPSPAPSTSNWAARHLERRTAFKVQEGNQWREVPYRTTYKSGALSIKDLDYTVGDALRHALYHHPARMNEGEKGMVEMPGREVIYQFAVKPQSSQTMVQVAADAVGDLEQLFATLQSQFEQQVQK